MNYTFKRIDNYLFELENFDVASLTVRVFEKVNCTDVVLLSEIRFTETYSFSLPQKDGEYTISISSLTEEEFHTITNYFDFFNSIIEDISIHVCDCGCNNCEDCNDEESINKILTKLISYNIVNNYRFNNYLLSTIDCIKCDLLDINSCIVSNEIVKGETDVSKLNRYLIEYYYLTYYFTDLKLQNDVSHYHFNKISKCLKNINPTCIKNKII